MENDLAVQPIEGFRIFRLDLQRLELRSLGVSDVWIPGEPKHSICKQTHGHTVHIPSVRCGCGIHAVKSRKMLGFVYPGFAEGVLTHQKHLGRTSKVEHLSARVKLWGVVVEQAYGYRAEWGEIIPETLTWWPRRNFKHNQKLLATLREKYTPKEKEEEWLI